MIPYVLKLSYPRCSAATNGNNFYCVCCRSMMRCIFSKLSDKTLPVWPPNCKTMDIVSHLHHSLFLKVMLNSRFILDDKFGKLADSEFVLIIHG